MKTKRIVSVFLVVMIAISSVAGVQAFGINENKNDTKALEALYEYVDAMDTQNWEKYISLSPTSEYNDLKDFFSNKEYIAENLGVHTVTSAKVVDIRELEPSSLPQYRLVEGIAAESPKGSVKAYLLGADLTVNEETKYHHNGTNMFTVILAKESDQWKVFAFSVATADTIRDAYADSKLRAAKDIDVSRMLEMAIKREKHAVWENIDGNIIVDNRATEAQLIEEAGGIENYQSATNALSAVSANHTRPGNIRIALYNSSGVRYDIVTVEYYDAIKNTLPNEWGKTWPMESLKAGAQCVKMVIWSLIVDPWYPNSGYDMKNNNDGHYLPNTEDANCTQAINAVGGIGMENSDGNIFYASYASGKQGYYGTQYSGVCSQWGSKKWADEGQGYFSILDYYYSYSSKSSGAIREFYY